MMIASNPAEGTWANQPGVLIEPMAPTFDTSGDDFQCTSDGCRTKDIHSIGVVSKVKLETVESPFSGIFKGADYGLIRHSTAGPYDPNTKLLKPGLGLKLLRDGVDSANLVSMYSVDGQDSWNYFKHDWSNHIPATTSPSLVPLGIHFYTETDYIQAVGLSDMAAYDQAGNSVDPVFPF